MVLMLRVSVILPVEIWRNWKGSVADSHCGKRSRGYQGAQPSLKRGIKPTAATSQWGAASVVAAHRITSSASMRRVGGMVRPSALAVFRLMANSNFIGRSTGRSAGLAPLRILST